MQKAVPRSIGACGVSFLTRVLEASQERSRAEDNDDGPSPASPDRRTDQSTTTIPDPNCGETVLWSVGGRWEPGLE